MTKVSGFALFREARKTNSLEPFDRTAEVMRDTRAGKLVRANAWKAIRFGLTGLAIRGYVEHVTEPLEKPATMGGRELNFRFTPATAPTRLDPTPIPYSAANSQGRIVSQTQGEYMFTQLEIRALGSALNYYREASDNPRIKVGAISVGQLLARTHDCVAEGERLGLDDVPDGYHNGFPIREDIYRQNKGTLIDIIDALSSVAGNVRVFMLEPVTAIMTRYANLYLDKTLRRPPSDELLANITYDRQEVSGLLVRTVREVAAAAYRHDFNDTTWVPESRGGKHKSHDFVLDRKGMLELVWDGKHQAAPPHLSSIPKELPLKGVTMLLNQEMCPVTYTASTSDSAGLLRLADANLVFMAENGMADPLQFMLPKITRPEHESLGL